MSETDRFRTTHELMGSSFLSPWEEPFYNRRSPKIVEELGRTTQVVPDETGGALVREYALVKEITPKTGLEILPAGGKEFRVRGVVHEAPYSYGSVEAKKAHLAAQAEYARLMEETTPPEIREILAEQNKLVREHGGFAVWEIEWRGKRDIKVYPTDFAEYRVGDRVTVLKDVATVKESQTWKDENMKPENFDEEVWRIAPLTYYGKGFDW